MVGASNVYVNFLPVPHCSPPSSSFLSRKFCWGPRERKIRPFAPLQFHFRHDWHPATSLLPSAAPASQGFPAQNPRSLKSAGGPADCGLFCTVGGRDSAMSVPTASQTPRRPFSTPQLPSCLGHRQLTWRQAQVGASSPWFSRCNSCTAPCGMEQRCPNPMPCLFCFSAGALPAPRSRPSAPHDFALRHKQRSISHTKRCAVITISQR